MSAARTLPFRGTRFGSPGAGSLSLGIPAAAYPGRVATNSDLIVAVDQQQTTLLLPMGVSDLTATVLDPSSIKAFNLLSIDSEIVKTLGPPAGNVIPVSRGFDGTLPAAHVSGAIVAGFIDAYHHNAVVAEIEAIETFLGPNGINIPSSSQQGPIPFTPQTPGGNLVVGANAITMSPVPKGVNGTDVNHYLWISGGTGTAEAALITGGSGVAGQPSGQIIITCANAHSGAWTIQTASAGIQEAIVANAGGSVQIPAGFNVIHAPITVDLPGVQAVAIVGLGVGISYIARSQEYTAGNIIQSLGNRFCSLTVANLSIYQGGYPGFSVMTSGAGIFISGQNAVDNTLYNLSISNGWRAVSLLSSSRVNGYNVEFIQDSAWSASFASDAGLTITGDSGGNVFENFHVSCGDDDTTNMIHYGIHITGNDGLQLTDIDIKARVGIFIDGSDATVAIANLKGDGVIVDRVRESGILIQGNANGTVTNIRFNNYHVVGYSAFSAHLLWGIFLNTTAATNVIFNNGVVSGFASGGIGIATGGVRQVIVSSSQIFSNTGGSGIQWAPGEGGTTVECCQIFGTQTFGLNFPGAATEMLIANNDLTGNTSAAINGAVNLTSGRIEGNPGYNPVGLSAITVTASPFTYTAGPSPEVVYITAGTVSLIKRGATTVATASPAQITLPPFGTVQVTYSAAPTMVKDVQ